LACSLLGLEQENQLDTHYLKGALYENCVITELLKGRLNRGLPGNLYFWRDHTGHEVDLIAEWSGSLRAFEIKSGRTLQRDFVKNLIYFCKLSAAQGYLIYEGAEQGSFLDITLVPLKNVERVYE
jgi:predicted AAA+ superfamily ATPase